MTEALDRDDSVVLDGVEVLLSPQEHALLRVLAGEPGRAWPRGDLARAVFAGEVGATDLLIDVQVAALQRKLRRARPGREWIDTVDGTSYAFVG